MCEDTFLGLAPQPHNVEPDVIGLRTETGEHFLIRHLFVERVSRIEHTRPTQWKKGLGVILKVIAHVVVLVLESYSKSSLTWWYSGHSV